MKPKHNKKRNTAFLYEVLIRELTKSITRRDQKKKKNIILILKEHFGINSILYKELQLYKDIFEKIEDETIDFHTAEKILHEAKITYWQGFDRKKIYKEQGEVISKINKDLSKSVFSNFIPNYKDLATLSQIFDDDLTIKKRVMLERQVVKKMMSDEEEGSKEIKPINDLTYKTFIKKFNSTYASLNESQRELLKHCILSFSDDGISLKLFLNEEVGRLKEIINESLKMEEITSDTEMLDKTKKVIDLMEGYKKQKISNDMVKQVLKIQEFVKEIQG